MDGSIFLTFFKNIFISTKCLIMHCIFVLTIVLYCCTIAYTQHKPDLVSCEVAFFTRFTHTPFVHKLCRSSTDCAFTQESATDLWLFTTNTTFIHYFDFKSKRCFWKCFFSIVILFYHSTGIQSFIDIFTFKLNKYNFVFLPPRVPSFIALFI